MRGPKCISVCADRQFKYRQPIGVQVSSSINTFLSLSPPLSFKLTSQKLHGLGVDESTSQLSLLWYGLHLREKFHRSIEGGDRKANETWKGLLRNLKKRRET